jgi:TonB family protein
VKFSSIPFAAAILSLAPCPPLTPARQSNQRAAAESCAGPSYRSSEVTRAAVVTRKPEPGFTDEARAENAWGVVRLEAVMCRTGRVTDIRVVRGLGHGLTEKAVEAARRIEFRPALKDGRKVSQRVTLEYNFNVSGGEGEGPEGWAKHTGRLVEELIVEGNRRLTAEEILRHVRTRPGEAFSEATVRGDLQTLLELGTLDPTQTRITTGAGLRGGVVVTFAVFELPIIRDIEIKGPKQVAEAEVLALLRRGGVYREATYRPDKVEAARRELVALFASRGHAGATLEVMVESVSTQSVVLRFVFGGGGRRTFAGGRS